MVIIFEGWGKRAIENIYYIVGLAPVENVYSKKLRKKMKYYNCVFKQKNFTKIYSEIVLRIPLVWNS